MLIDGSYISFIKFSLNINILNFSKLNITLLVTNITIQILFNFNKLNSILILVFNFRFKFY